MSCFSPLWSLASSCWDFTKGTVTLEVNLLTPEEVQLFLTCFSSFSKKLFQAEDLRVRRTVWNLPSCQDARWQDNSRTFAEVANENAALRIAENFPSW